MIIHAYLTDGFFPWAKLYLESFKFHNGEDYLVILSTRDLTEEQVSELNSLYKNLIVKNEQFDIDSMSKKAGLNKIKLLKLKNEVETKHVTKENKVWKLMVAADDRVKSTLEVMKEYKNEDYILHTDIDMYFRGKLTGLFNFIKKYDVSIRLRLSSAPNRKTMIGVQGYKLSNKTISFVEKWIGYVESIAPKDRPLGYGQTACYYAYEDYKNICKWGSVPRKFIAPRMLDSDIIWSANTKKGKTENLKICYKDFKEIKNVN